MSQPAEIYTALHTRIMEADPTASSELAELVLPAIVQHLQIHFRGKYPNLVIEKSDYDDAAADAYIGYVLQPDKFNPAKSNLLTYLQMAARGDLHNNLAKKHRAQFRQVPLEIVELHPPSGNSTIEEQYIEQEEENKRDSAFTEWQNQRTEVAAKNDLDRQLMELLNRGERRNSEYARILAITHLPQPEQDKIVKRHKDRLKVRLKRKRQDNETARSQAKEKNYL